MGVVRVEQARAAGADVIVTACPYCLANIEDAIKVAGLEGELEAIDLVELIDRQAQADPGSLPGSPPVGARRPQEERPAPAS
ncbi:MAG: hypothetical protein ACOC3J_06545, partial [Gemmatimonadota bacterium]